MALVKIDIRAINKQLTELVAKREDITLEQIPEILRPEFEVYIVGKTVYKRDSQIWISYHDFIKWVRMKYE